MKIENYRELPPGGYAVAMFDVYLDGIQLTLRNLKLCLSKKGHHFVGYPSFGVENDPGSPKTWVQYFEFSKEKKIEFDKKIMEELGPYVKGPLRAYKSDY